MAQMTPLRRRLLDDMTVRNLSPATQQSYVYAVAKLSRFFGVAPDQLGNEEVRTYQVHLAGLGMSWSHINQVSCALRFFYGVTLGRKDAAVRIVSGKEPRKLPVVLSVDEIVRFLQAVPGLRNRTALTTGYVHEFWVLPHFACYRCAMLHRAREPVEVGSLRGRT